METLIQSIKKLFSVQFLKFFVMVIGKGLVEAIFGLLMFLIPFYILFGGFDIQNIFSSITTGKVVEMMPIAAAVFVLLLPMYLYIYWLLSMMPYTYILKMHTEQQLPSILDVIKQIFTYPILKNIGMIIIFILVNLILVVISVVLSIVTIPLRFIPFVGDIIIQTISVFLLAVFAVLLGFIKYNYIVSGKIMQSLSMGGGAFISIHSLKAILLVFLFGVLNYFIIMGLSSAAIATVIGFDLLSKAIFEQDLMAILKILQKFNDRSFVELLISTIIFVLVVSIIINAMYEFLKLSVIYQYLQRKQGELKISK
ncbi:MAG: hypothetical protein N3C61_03150 [Candidatus Micrarchaeota archaeon]|nr:hypothetical protein [Candidatus Micrarchaeota archaeon]